MAKKPMKTEVEQLDEELGVIEDQLSFLEDDFCMNGELFDGVTEDSKSFVRQFKEHGLESAIETSEYVDACKSLLTAYKGIEKMVQIQIKALRKMKADTEKKIDKARKAEEKAEAKAEGKNGAKKSKKSSVPEPTTFTF